MTATARALVQTGISQTEFREIPLPRISDGAGLVRVEANGLCASDIDAMEGNPPFVPANLPLPRINGHEIVGVVEELSEGKHSRAGLKVGDRIAINPFLSCGNCPACLEGQPALCSGWDFPGAHAYGYISTAVEPQLWGGYSTHVYLHPKAVMYPFPSTTSPLDATIWNPLAAGIQWSVMTPGTKLGSTVAILGAGQRGLASVVATRAAGAGLVVATGLSSDRHKLDLALRLGADAVIDVQTESTVDRIRELTGGVGVDIVVDTSPHSTQPILDALQAVRPGGTVVLAGMKGRGTNDFPTDLVVNKGLRILGAVGMTHAAYSMAASLVASERFPLSEMRTHVVGYDHMDYAIDLLAGRVPGEKAINVVVTPTTDND